MRCPTCAFENPAGMRFCGHCGTLLPGAGAGEERRLVTVLFADLAGFTGLADALDPEDLRAVVSRFYGMVAAEVRRFGGTVEKYVGDAALAIFGLPEVHEDDALRAVRAALAMRGALARLNEQLAAEGAPTLAMRIGINTGEVVADPRGGGLGEFHLAADAVNVAARLQQHGRPGAILIGARTEALVRDQVETAPLGPLALKGKERPVPAWEVVGLRTRPGAPAGGRAPLIGRTGELDLLLRLYDRVVTERRAHLVTVLGAAGVGKSRLQQEFLGLLRALPETPAIGTGRCLPYGEGLAFWPVAEILKQDAQIRDDDPEDAAREKLHAAVARLLPDEADTVAAALGFLIGLVFPGSAIAAYDPRSAREEAFLSWRRYLEARARQRPLVLVVEDLHWGDEGLLDLLDYTASRLREVPVLILAAARPELLERRPHWGGGARDATRIDLSPLDAAEARRLLAALLPGSPTLPERLAGRIAEAAEGNPFFMEEMARLLVEEGVLTADGDRWRTGRALDDLPLPDTVQGVIAARLDRLPDDEKRVLQQAAVVGRIFWMGTLRALVEASVPLAGILDRLEGRDLIRERAESTLAGDREFIFKHILTREVAYATLPRAVRARTHAQVAAWVERTAAGRTEELLDLLAYHWTNARDPARALEYLVRAGDRARRLFANRRAADAYTRAFTLGVDLAPGLRLRLLRHRAEARQLVGEYDGAEADIAEALRLLLQAAGGRDVEPALRFEQVRLVHRRRRAPIPEIIAGYEEARRLAADAGDRRTEGLCLLETANAHWDQNRPDEAERLARAALPIFEALGDHGAVAGVLNLLSTVRWLVRDLAGALELAERGIAEARAGGDRAREATARSYRGLYLWLGGRAVEALDALEEADRLAEEIGDRRRRMWIAQFSGMAELGRARLEAAARHLETSLQLLRDIGYTNPVTFFNCVLLHRTLGDLGPVLALVDEFPPTVLRPGDVHRPTLAAAHALLAVERGERDSPFVDEVVEAVRQPIVSPSTLTAAADVAHALALAGDAGRAEALAQAVLAQIPAGWLPTAAAHAGIALATGSAVAGRLAEATGHLDRVDGVLRGLGFRLLEAEAALARGAVLAARGDRPGARAQAARARALVEAVAGEIADERVRARFLAGPLGRRTETLLGTEAR